MSEEEVQKLSSDDTIMAEATLWFGRMRGPEADVHKAEFEKWLVRGALHRRFYNRAGEIYAMGKFLKDEQEQAAEGHHPGDRQGHRMWFRTAARVSIGFAAAISVGFFALNPGPILKDRPEHAREGMIGSSLRLVTKSGQRLTQRLADGSRVTLEADSTVLVTYDGAQRMLRLERGQSRFEVAHEARPFVVLAGNGRITARGTIFEVGLRRDSHVMVRLLQGKIDVSTPGPQGKRGEVRHLTAGDAMSFPARVSVPAPASGAPAAPVLYDLPDEAQAYQEFDGMPLGAVIELAGQRGGRPIQLASADLKSLKVSGRFRLNEPEKLARKVAVLFDLEVATGPANEIVLRQQ